MAAHERADCQRSEERLDKNALPLLQEANRRRGPAVRQSLDFPLPALRALAKLDMQ